MRRIGLMGGSFDPIHLGHLVTAEQARVDLVLDEMLFIPAGQPWQKSHTTPAEHRYLMAVLATSANPHFGVSRIELDREGPTYTVETLRELRAQNPDAEFWFISGVDAVVNIVTWRDADEALSLAKFVAATRPGHDFAALDETGVRERITTLDVPALAISSTDIRERIAAGRSVRYLIPREVEEYIHKHGLYGAPAVEQAGARPGARPGARS